MAPILTAEDVVRRIAIECAHLDERGAVGIRLNRQLDRPPNGAFGARPIFSRPTRRMTTPAAAPMNSSKHAVDWMKKPGNRFSTALL
jgi:hypothetical protein